MRNEKGNNPPPTIIPQLPNPNNSNLMKKTTYEQSIDIFNCVFYTYNLSAKIKTKFNTAKYFCRKKR
jgi:hypothetical protein